MKRPRIIRTPKVRIEPEWEENLETEKQAGHSETEAGKEKMVNDPPRENGLDKPEAEAEPASGTDPEKMKK